MSILKLKIYVVMTAIAISIIGCGGNPGAQKEIRVGAILGLSGNSGSLGEDTRNGLQLAIDEQNSKGGLLGLKIVLDVQDSKTEGNTGVSIAKQMLESGGNKPVAIYTQSSVVSMPVKPVAEANRTVMFAISGADRLLSNSKYVFRNWANPQTAGKALVAYLGQPLSSKKLGIFFCNNDYGKSMQEYVANSARAAGMEVVFASAFDEKDGDYKSLLADQLSKSNVDAIYTVGLGSGLGILTKQLRASGYAGNVISDITAPYPDVLNAAGDAAKGMYYLDFAYRNDSTEPAQRDYHDKFVKAYGKEPLNFSVVSYEAMRLLFKAIEQANSLDSDKVADELNKIQNFPGVFGATSIQNNEVIYSLDVKQVKQ